MEVYHIEIKGLCGSLQAVLSIHMIRLASEIYVCTNNLNITRKGKSVPNGSSQAVFLK